MIRTFKWTQGGCEMSNPTDTGTINWYELYQQTERLMKKTSSKLKEADDLIGSMRVKEDELLAEIEQLKEKLDEFQTDQLTDLMPSKLFNKILEKYFLQAQRSLQSVTNSLGKAPGKSLTILVIDVDRFSMINDQ